MEGAAAGGFQRARHLTDDGYGPRRGRAGRSRGGHQGRGVGVLRIRAGELGVAQLHQFAQVHDADGVAHVLDRGQVVRD